MELFHSWEGEGRYMVKQKIVEFFCVLLITINFLLKKYTGWQIVDVMTLPVQEHILPIEFALLHVPMKISRSYHF